MHFFKVFLCALLLITCATTAPAIAPQPAAVGINCPDGQCSLIGRSAYLPDIDLLGTPPSGVEIFKNMEYGDCALYEDIGHSSSKLEIHHRIENFLTHVSSTTGISATLPIRSFTFGATFQHMSGEETSIDKEVSSGTLDISMVSGMLHVNENSTCWGLENLTDDFRTAFTKLPANIDPVSEQDWTIYRTFLRRWGSHVAMKRDFGSRFQQWTSVSNLKEENLKFLQVRACVDVEGINPAKPGWSVKSCAQYDEQTRRKASDFDFKAASKIVGGSKATRDRLLTSGGLNEQSLSAFIAASGSADEPIRTQWRPLWDVLLGFHGDSCSSDGNCADFQRALNLQAAFEGRMATACSRETISGPNGETAYQEMRALGDSGETTLYACVAGREGCHQDSDCHIGGAGSVCYCYGASCISATGAPIGPPMRPTARRNIIQLSKDEKSYKDGANRSCKYQIGVTCGCKGDFPGERYLWRQTP